jgi:alkylation response protein AidB-like acyl-CoA dehydrogenase
MKMLNDNESVKEKKKYRAFVDSEIAPYAEQFDKQEKVPDTLIDKLGDKGYLGACIPPESGGMGMNAITFGGLCEEIGRGSASLSSLLAVHGMVSQALIKWGSSAQKDYWLPRLASGRKIGAFALTEPSVGSDAKSIESKATKDNGSYVLSGKKKWISFGQIADVFLIIAQYENQPTAFIVEKDTPGFTTTPIMGMLGFRAAMLAKVNMENCRVPEENIIGKIGFGFSHVVGSALDYGRYCIAWSCVGLAQACLEASLRYAKTRKQGGSYLKEYQLVQAMIADMITNVKAARLLCLEAGLLKDRGEPSSIMETSIAKYFASKIAIKTAGDAVQIHGANGCSSEYPLQRYLRDAKVMEIIEGSTQIQQIMISKYGYINAVEDEGKDKGKAGQ